MSFRKIIAALVITFSFGCYASVPYIFATQTGNVPASWLDADFSYLNTLVTTNRTSLTANTTYYVSTVGSDANPCTASFPCLTIQHAINYVQDYIDTAGYNVTISVAAGTYASGALIDEPFTGGGKVTLTTTGTVIVQGGLNYCFQVADGGEITIAPTGSGKFELQPASGNIALSALTHGRLYFSGVQFDAVTSGIHIYSTRFGYIEANGNYTINGGATNHIQSSHQGNFRATNSSTATFLQSVTFTQTVQVLADADATWTGGASFSTGAFTVTGQRYYVYENGSIQWSGGSQTSIPGTTQGIENSGGRYVYQTYPVDVSTSQVIYDLSTASGTLVLNNIGFQAGELEIFASKIGDTTAPSIGWAVINPTPGAAAITNYANSGGTGNSPDSTHCLTYYTTSTTAGVQMAVSSSDTNSITLTTTKTGSPTGTLYITYKARRFQ
jgi:hypothetical protein